MKTAGKPIRTKAIQPIEHFISKSRDRNALNPATPPYLRTSPKPAIAGAQVARKNAG